MTQSRDGAVAPRLIVLNQTVSPAFLDWLSSLADTHCPLELWSGNPPVRAGPGVTVRRFTPYNNSSVSHRLLTWSWFTLQSLWRLLRLGGQTPLFVVTNPPFMALAAPWLRVVQGRRYGLLEWDIYPQILNSMGLAGPKNPLYQLWRRLHVAALRNADLVVTLGDRMANVLQGMAGKTQLPLTVVPNWVDTDWLKPWPRAQNPFVQELRLQDKLVVLYSGNLGATHAIDTILETARLLANESRICFLVIGDGSKRGLVEAAIASGKTPTLRLLPLQPTNRLPFTLSSGHVGVVTLGVGYEGLSMPSKTYALMAAGNAILGISRPPNDLADTIARHNCGVNFHPDQSEAIAAWLRSLLSNPALLERLQLNARQAAVAHYSTKTCTALLNAVVSSALLGGQRTRMA